MGKSVVRWIARAAERGSGPGQCLATVSASYLVLGPYSEKHTGEMPLSRRLPASYCLAIGGGLLDCPIARASGRVPCKDASEAACRA